MHIGFCPWRFPPHRIPRTILGIVLILLSMISFFQYDKVGFQNGYGVRTTRVIFPNKCYFIRGGQIQNGVKIDTMEVGIGG